MSLSIDEQALQGLSKRTAIIIGGASGIGIETVKLLVSRGAAVYIFDRNALKDETGWWQGRLDVYFHTCNAWLRRWIFFADTCNAKGELALPESVLDVNFWGVLYVVKLAWSSVRHHHIKGSIVITGSTTGYAPEVALPVLTGKRMKPTFGKWRASANHGHSTPATSPCQSRPNGASNNRGHASATRSEDALFRSVVDAWISDRELTALATQGFNRTSGSSGTDCYTAVLARTTKLEQALSQAPSPLTIDLVLEAERDFSNLRHRLFACTGHRRLLPVETTSPLSMAAPPTISSTDPCLATNRPVLLGLAILAERVTGLFEEMFRLAAQVSQSIDQANDFVWSETLGTTDLSSRRAHRSLRNVMNKPCASLGMVSYRELRLDDFVVEGQAKTDTMGRILKLRVKRMLRALERKRGQLSGGPLDWGSSTTVLDTIAGTLLDDLMRRMESLQGAMTLL
ncbi:hypothetical protein F5Y09DRAFT_333787 [Xylaria sp. FL1042]|nr:hypothetical protein F5Y09DRAFT_333787 [Xylaria sp. FL1042]